MICPYEVLWNTGALSRVSYPNYSCQEFKMQTIKTRNSWQKSDSQSPAQGQVMTRHLSYQLIIYARIKLVVYQWVALGLQCLELFSVTLCCPVKLYDVARAHSMRAPIDFCANSRKYWHDFNKKDRWDLCRQHFCPGPISSAVLLKKIVDSKNCLKTKFILD